MGENEDVLKIIKNQKLECRVLVSSRPQSTFGIEEYFPTVVRVEGFTEKEARKFVSNFFSDESKIEQIMKFRPSDSREDFPVHKYPILLSILCFLVDRQEVDLSDTNITMGDLYFKMVECLYKTYTVKKGMPYKESDLIKVMRSVGKLALHTLLSSNPLLQRSQVLETAGDFALEYGFFAVEKDFTHHNADISVTYAHRSLEEFFGSFGFLQALDDGKSVDDILGSDCKKPIFMVNPLVLRFCLWLLTTTTEFFSSQRIVYDKLVTYAAQRIDFYMLNTDIVSEIYPAMNIIEAVYDKDTLKLEFFKQVFEKCEQVRVIHARVTEIIGRDEVKVKGIVELISHKMSLLSIGENSLPSSLPAVNSSALTVSIKCRDSVSCELISKTLQTNSDVLKREPLVYARVHSEHSQDLKTLVQKHIKELHVVSSSFATLSVSGEFPFCPHFTHFTAEVCQISDSVPEAFMKAVKEGKFPCLRRIELNDCTMNDCEWPEVPEFSWNSNTVKMCDSSQIHKPLLKLTRVDSQQCITGTFIC